MSDYLSALPIRNGDNSGVDDEIQVKTKTNGAVVAAVCDGTTNTQKLAVTAVGRVGTIVHDATTDAQTLKVDASGDIGTVIRDSAGAEKIGQELMVNSIPVVVASDQSPIDVNIVSDITPTPLHQYGTAVAAVINTPTNVIDFTNTNLTKTLYIEEVYVSSSGQARWEVKTGVIASETTKSVSFTSKSDLNEQIHFSNPLEIAPNSTQKILVIGTNEDKAAMDLYAFVNGFYK